MDICAGGTISAGANEVCFTNNHDKDCTIESCGLPGWPKQPPVIPKKSTKCVSLSTPAQRGDYSYHPNCCGKKEMDPTIKVQ